MKSLCTLSLPDCYVVHKGAHLNRQSVPGVMMMLLMISIEFLTHGFLLHKGPSSRKYQQRLPGQPHPGYSLLSQCLSSVRRRRGITSEGQQQNTYVQQSHALTLCTIMWLTNAPYGSHLCWVICLRLCSVYCKKETSSFHGWHLNQYYTESMTYFILKANTEMLLYKVQEQYQGSG